MAAKATERRERVTIAALVGDWERLHLANLRPSYRVEVPLARGETDRAGLLREAATTLRALMRPAALVRAEPDIAALMEGEGIAMRPGPRPKLDPALLPTLRRAILGVQLVALRYARDADEAPVTRILCPYGTLYGGDGRAWLVGHVENLPDMRLWRLDRIASMDLLDRSFIRTRSRRGGRNCLRVLLGCLGPALG